MSFLRHDEIYRSDGGMKTILSLEPGAAPRWSAPSHDKGRGLDPAPFPSSAMSLGSAIPWRGALQHCPPPLHRPESMVYPPVETVNHHLTGAGELSTGDLRNFHPALTHLPHWLATCERVNMRTGCIAFRRLTAPQSLIRASHDLPPAYPVAQLNAPYP